MNKQMGAAMGGAVEDTREEIQEGPETTISLADYPELKDAKAGDSVEGSFSGTVKAVNPDGTATISYTDLQFTGNQANAALAKMGQSDSPSKVAL